MPFDGTPQDPLHVEAKMVLGRAIELVEKGWCRRHMASGGWYLFHGDITHPGLKRFCAAGAIKRAEFELGLDGDEARRRLRSVAGSDIGWWNDNCASSAVVLAGMRRAMA
jgi:hypothetical protein